MNRLLNSLRNFSHGFFNTKLGYELQLKGESYREGKVDFKARYKVLWQDSLKRNEYFADDWKDYEGPVSFQSKKNSEFMLAIFPTGENYLFSFEVLAAGKTLFRENFMEGFDLMFFFKGKPTSSKLRPLYNIAQVYLEQQKNWKEKPNVSLICNYKNNWEIIKIEIKGLVPTYKELLEA